MSLEFAREEERPEVRELCWPRDSEGLTACKDRQMIQGLKLDVDLKIRQSEGDQKTAWLAIESASTSHVPMLNLQYLHGLSDAILGHVSTMTHLKSIDLSSSSGASAEGIKHLYRLQWLEKLNFSKSDVLDSALESIGSLSSLKQLLLSFTKLTDAGLSHLTGLSSLQLLSLTECMGVTNASMVNVGRLTGLEELWLGGTAVTDDGLQQLTALIKLKGLWTSEEDYLRNDEVYKRIGWSGGRDR
ncbi:unnamed protein product [Closterium sp. Yama58-4]|nr:unnamed protein product [Closterium sp. Yama58-4]